MNPSQEFNYKDFCIKNFDSEYYLSCNEDVKKMHTDPLQHYINFGFFEGRRGFSKQSTPVIDSSLIDIADHISLPIKLFIPTFNNPSYLRNFFSQIHDINWITPIVYDNNSSTRKMLNLLDSLDSGGIEIIRNKTNFGPESIYLNKGAINTLPDFFLLSDPDLDLCGNLNLKNLKKLLYVSEFYQLGKVGFALKCEKNKITTKTLRHGKSKTTTYDWEKQFWINKLGSMNNGDPIYSAAIGATICLVNKKFLDLNYHWSRGARIGGTLTIRHLPWEVDKVAPRFEMWRYRSLQQHSFYSLPTFKKRLESFFKETKEKFVKLRPKRNLEL